MKVVLLTETKDVSRLAPILIAIIMSCVNASTAQEIMNFNQLPKEVRDLAIDVRKPMQGF
jgi:hypothetical protein